MLSLTRLDEHVRSAGFRTSSAFGRLIHANPNLEHHIFGRVDPVHLRRWDHVRTVAALWNIDAMDRLDVPWWTWTAIRDVERFLAGRLRPRAFEWGSGASTFWLARRCASVVSVEHHAGFARHTAAMMARFDNVEVLVREPRPIEEGGAAPMTSGKRGNEGLDFSSYVAAIDDTGARYDLIVVDGRARSDCLARASQYLSDGGRIVFDNSNRPRYQASLRQFGGELQRYPGRGPGSPTKWETSILKGARSESG